MDRQYEAPRLTDIASVHEATLQNKARGSADGFILVPDNVPLRNT